MADSVAPGNSWSHTMTQLRELLDSIPREKQLETIAVLESYAETWKSACNDNTRGTSYIQSEALKTKEEEQQLSETLIAFNETVEQVPRRRCKKTRTSPSTTGGPSPKRADRGASLRLCMKILPADTTDQSSEDVTIANSAPTVKRCRSSRMAGQRRCSQLVTSAPVPVAKDHVEPRENRDQTHELGDDRLSAAVQQSRRKDKFVMGSSASPCEMPASNEVDDVSREEDTVDTHNDQVYTSPVEQPGRPVRTKKQAKDWKELLALRTCQVCGRILSSRTSLQQHLALHLNYFPHKCQYCDKGFHQKISLRIHETTYHCMEEPKFKCSQCDFTAHFNFKLTHHFKTVHSEHKDAKQFLCTVCGKAFGTKKRLRVHQEVHMPRDRLKCPDCDYSTHSSDCIRLHRRNMHPKVARVPVICEVCGGSFMSRLSLKAHKLKHYNITTHTCAICGKSYSASAYHNHLLTHQQPTHECEICHKKFQTKDKLKRHSLIHTGDKPFQCPACNYCCNVEGNLRKHCLNSHDMVYPPKRRREVMKLQ